VTWADALGIGLGLLSIPVNAAVLYLIYRTTARWWCMIVLTIDGISGGEPDDDYDGRWVVGQH